MVNKVKIYITKDGIIFPVDGTKLSDGFVTSNGKYFMNELDAYKYDNEYLEKVSKKKSIEHIAKIEINDKISSINGIDVSELKVYDVGKLATSSCECIPNVPLIYLWYNTIEKKPYIGSSKTPQYRASTFINMEAAYAGNKINKARERYSGVYGIAWKYYILEENVNETDLLEREKYYIYKFNSIFNGYNTAIPTSTHNIPNDKQRINDLFLAFCKRVENWGMTVGNTITAEKYAEMYNLPKYLGGSINRRNPYTTRYPSFRLSCFMNNTVVVEYDNLKKMLYGLNQIIDLGKNGFKDNNEVLPSSMIRYRATDNAYLSIDDNSTTFETAGEAVVYRIENIRKKMLEYLDEDADKDEYRFISNASTEVLIDLCYHDADNVKKFLKDSENDKMFSREIKNEITCYNNQSITSQELIEKYTGLTINGSLVEFKNILTYHNLLPNNRYKYCKRDTNGVFLCYNTIENKPFVGATVDILKRLPSFFYVGAFGGKKLDEIRKKYYDEKDAWVIFILEENVPLVGLTEMLNHYMNIFDSVNNGYNKKSNISMVYSEDIMQKREIKKKITESKNFIKKHYGFFKENVTNCGMNLDKLFTLELYEKIINNSGMFNEKNSFMKRDIDKYPSFRIPCLLNNTNVVTGDIVQFLPYGIVKHTDFIKSWNMCYTEIGEIPNFIRYNVYTKEYTAYGLCGRYYPTLKEVLIAYCQMLIDKIQNSLNKSVRIFEIDAKIIEYIENMNYETLLRITFKNPEPLINIINSKSNIIEAETAASMATS